MLSEQSYQEKIPLLKKPTLCILGITTLQAIIKIRQEYKNLLKQPVENYYTDN